MNNSVSGRGQLTLPLAIRDKPGFDQFIIGENVETVDLLKSIARGVRQTRLYLWGGTGNGISHLLQACCILADNLGRSVAYIPLREFPQLTPAMLEGLDRMVLVCIDDIDAIAGHGAWEQALFHLYNRLRDNNTSLLMGSHTNPRTLGFQLADLTSRMIWDLVYHVKPPDDADRVEALQRRAHARGFRLPGEVAEFLVKRVNRDMPNLIDLLNQLEQATLAEQRRLTIPFVRTYLEKK